MKKGLATLLCLVMTFGILSGCSKANTNSKPNEDPVDSSIEESTTEAPTEEPTEQPTESVTTEPQQTEGEIIPLFPASSSDQVHQLSPEELQQGSNFISLFNASDTGRTYGDVQEGTYAATLYTTELMNRSFEIGYPQPNGTSITVTMFFVGPIQGGDGAESHVFDCIYYEIEGGESGTFVRFMPLYYNPTKQCLVGYQRQEGVYSLYEIYWDGTWFSTQPVTDMSLYGF